MSHASFTPLLSFTDGSQLVRRTCIDRIRTSAVKPIDRSDCIWPVQHCQEPLISPAPDQRQPASIRHGEHLLDTAAAGAVESRPLIGVVCFGPIYQDSFAHFCYYGPYVSSSKPE